MSEYTAPYGRNSRQITFENIQNIPKLEPSPHCIRTKYSNYANDISYNNNYIKL